MLTLRRCRIKLFRVKCCIFVRKKILFMTFVCSLFVFCGISIISQSPSTERNHETPAFKIKLELTELERYRLTTTHHCEVVSIGCFTKKSEIVKPAISASFNFMTRNMCWSFCSSSEKVYAGLISGNVCVCTTDFLDLATANYGNCNKSCSGERKETCGDVKSIEVFRLLSTCQKGSLVSKEYGTSRLIGCFESPSKTVLDASIKKHRINVDCSECVLFCGMFKFPLALRNSKNECLCWEMTKRLNLSHKQKQCNEKSLKVYRTLAEDKRCRSVQFLPTMATRPTCGLVTFPGSGNTWARYLLEQATRLYTGSVYGDNLLHKSGSNTDR